MEMKKRRQKTLTGLFLKFAALFCLDTFGIGMFCLVFLVLSPMTGFTLPANYAELQLTDHTEEIRAAGTDVEALIPDGCRYGIYDATGRFKTGTFSADAQKRAWQGYKNGSKYASMGKYYRYIKQNSGDIFIVKYDLHMRYAYDKLNGIVPSLEILTPVLGVVLFFLHAILLSGHFAKKLKRELRQLREVTEKIGQNDLEFETGPSQIKEIDDVMSSLSGMKEALKDSLTRQWDAQQQKKEQLAALTHDIKTPLTVIKGNAELLAETDLSAENRECTGAILANVGSMEQYLEHMRQLLYGHDRAEETEVVTCARLKEQFKEAAMQIAAAEKVPVVFQEDSLCGNVCCKPGPVGRAWKNVVSNAVEHTDRARGIVVRLQMEVYEGQEYLTATVRDFGKGFSEQDLIYADQEFYSGDASRHDRTHQGLGLAIAKKFLKEQGGMLCFYNHAESGAEVVCRIKTAELF